MDVVTVEELCHEIGGIALGNGVKVEFGVGRFAQEASIVVADGAVGGMEEAGEGCAVGFATLFETEPPGLYEASHPDVEGSVGVVHDVQGILQEELEDVVERVGLTGVDASQQRGVDPEGCRAVEGLEEGVDLRL